MDKRQQKKERHRYETITVVADIHADGDVYVFSNNDAKFHYVGCLAEKEVGVVPDSYYKKAKKIIGI